MCMCTLRERGRRTGASNALARGRTLIRYVHSTSNERLSSAPRLYILAPAATRTRTHSQSSNYRLKLSFASLFSRAASKSYGLPKLIRSGCCSGDVSRSIVPGKFTFIIVFGEREGSGEKKNEARSAGGALLLLFYIYTHTFPCT